MNAKILLSFIATLASSAALGCGSDTTDAGGAGEETMSSELAVGGCGQLDKPCCSGSLCKKGLTCNYDHCSAGCGDLGQECCLPEQRCMPGYACNATTLHCELPCGALGQACCAASTCESGLFCNWDHCAQSCGDVGQECCLPENICMPGLACTAGTCQ